MPASRSISKLVFLSSLPPWRHLLARLDWNPSLDAQINAIESRRETERLRNETAQLKIENVRLTALESKFDSLLLSADSPRNQLQLS